MSLTDRVICNVMGKDAGEFLKTREVWFNEWRKNEYAKEGFPLTEINEMLKEANLEPLEGGFELERFKL